MIAYLCAIGIVALIYCLLALGLNRGDRVRAARGDHVRRAEVPAELGARLVAPHEDGQDDLAGRVPGGRDAAEGPAAWREQRAIRGPCRR